MSERRNRTARGAAGLASLVLHGLILGALALARPAETTPEPRPILVALVPPTPPRPEPPPPEPAEAPEGPAENDTSPPAAAAPPAPAPKLA
ncbi:MAG: hypothetical protein ACT6RY_00005, partial [Phenylobacterium sp.]